jgi:hypothetical protein
MHGASSKIKRFYWRELSFETMNRFAVWAADQGLDVAAAYLDLQHRPERELAAEQSLVDIKSLHARAPKYSMEEESQESLIRRCGVRVDRIDAVYQDPPTGPRVRLLLKDGAVDVNEFVKRHFEGQGYKVVFLESRPFHVLFGVFMWIVVQAPADDLGSVVSFGDRVAYEAGTKGELVWLRLPKDFGTGAYAQRRRDAIDAHLSDDLRLDLEWTFEYWLQHSSDLRNYLWAHRAEDVAVARQLLKLLPSHTVVSILRYLIDGYWERYLGWPDLLIYRDGSWSFVEIKSSSDKLSVNQKRWIADNHAILGLPFRIIKIHRSVERGPARPSV